MLHSGWLALFSVFLIGFIEQIPLDVLAGLPVGLPVVIGLQLVKLADLPALTRSSSRSLAVNNWLPLGSRSFSRDRPGSHSMDGYCDGEHARPVGSARGGTGGGRSG